MQYRLGKGARDRFLTKKRNLNCAGFDGDYLTQIKFLDDYCHLTFETPLSFLWDNYIIKVYGGQLFC